MTHPLVPLARAFENNAVRYTLIGVSGANLYGPMGQAVFTTEDFDFFLPIDPENLLRAWNACDATNLELWLDNEPLDRPHDRWLADRVTQRLALTRAIGSDGFVLDLSLVMKGYEFETVWNERREFLIEGTTIPVARLLHIVTSKHATGRDKDRLFLATHRDALEQLLKTRDAD